MEENELEIIRENKNYTNLPEFEALTKPPEDSIINNMNSIEFIKIIDSTYDEITHWRKNLFKLPSGKGGKMFITELTKWLETFNVKGHHYNIAIKVFMILSAILLQKPTKNSKAKEHSQKLEERRQLWRDGKLLELLIEERQIQKKLHTSKHQNNQDDARIFSNLIMQGKVNAALKMLAKSETRVHKVTDDIVKELQAKHPKPEKIQDETLLQGPINKVPASYFDEIDEKMVFKACTRTQGAGGPSHMDADQYRHLLTSKKFKKENKDLREQIACLAKKLASECINPYTIEAFVACRLIPLDKNPGVRPIGVNRRNYSKGQPSNVILCPWDLSHYRLPESSLIPSEECLLS